MLHKEFSIVDIFKVLIRKWWILLISAIIFGCFAFAVSNYLIAATYVSKGMIYVNSDYISELEALKNDSFKDLNLSTIVSSQKLATTYIEILKSNSFLNAVSEHANIGISGERILKMMSIKTKNETEVLEISISNTNPQTATILVDSILELSKKHITRVVNGGSVEIIDKARYPVLPVGPNKPKYVFAGLLFGILISSLILMLADILDNRVKDQSDLTNRYTYPILGLIPSIRSSSRNYYYSKPTISAEKISEA